MLSPDRIRTGLNNNTRPGGLTRLPAAAADETELRGLDDRLRNDAAGTEGWVNDPTEFHEVAFDEAHFDPTTHLVAVDAENRRFAGLVRIWTGRSHARLGLIGVAPPYRRRGLARTLLAHPLHPVHERGITLVTADTDDTNMASLELLRGVGGVATGAATVLKRPATPNG